MKLYKLMNFKRSCFQNEEVQTSMFTYCRIDNSYYFKLTGVKSNAFKLKIFKLEIFRMEKLFLIFMSSKLHG